MINSRYRIMRDLDGIDCLRVEIDDITTNTTSVTHIPVIDIEKAIAQYKWDLYPLSGQAVRITSGDDSHSLIGHSVSVCDAQTGEDLNGVFRAVIILDATRINTVELTRYDLGNSHQETIKTDTLIMENPEVDVTALVISPKGVK